jgi:uncharacterized Zn finger protein (UPF0148 family)
MATVGHVNLSASANTEELDAHCPDCETTFGIEERDVFDGVVFCPHCLTRAEHPAPAAGAAR